MQEWTCYLLWHQRRCQSTTSSEPLPVFWGFCFVPHAQPRLFSFSFILRMNGLCCFDLLIWDLALVSCTHAPNGFQPCGTRPRNVSDWKKKQNVIKRSEDFSRSALFLSVHGRAKQIQLFQSPIHRWHVNHYSLVHQGPSPLLLSPLLHHDLGLAMCLTDWVLNPRRSPHPAMLHMLLFR